MNLYLISQRQNQSYDSYDSAVVAALNEDNARMIHPNEFFDGKSGSWLHAWAEPEDISIKLIGIAVEGIEQGDVICASFNAG